LMGSVQSASPYNELIIRNNTPSYSSMNAGNNYLATADITLSSGGTGFIGASRTDSINTNMRHEGVTDVGTQATTDGAPSNSILVGAIALNGFPLMGNGNSDIAAWGVGGGLTSIQLSDLRDAIQTFMTARGI